MDANGIDEDGNVIYRGYTIVVDTFQSAVWFGGKFETTISGSPHRALKRIKDLIDERLG